MRVWKIEKQRWREMVWKHLLFELQPSCYIRLFACLGSLGSGKVLTSMEWGSRTCCIWFVSTRVVSQSPNLLIIQSQFNILCVCVFFILKFVLFLCFIFYWIPVCELGPVEIQVSSFLALSFYLSQVLDCKTNYIFPSGGWKWRGLLHQV